MSKRYEKVIKKKTKWNEKENFSIWGCINNDKYKLEKPIITDEIGFYIISNNIEMIKAYYELICDKFNKPDSTFPIHFNLDKLFEKKEWNWNLLIERMYVIIIINSTNYNKEIHTNFCVINFGQNGNKQVGVFSTGIGELPEPETIVDDAFKKLRKKVE